MRPSVSFAASGRDSSTRAPPTPRHGSSSCCSPSCRGGTIAWSAPQASGAISQTLLALTKQGDHIICFVETYNPTRYLIRRLLARFGVTHTMLSIEDTAGVEKALAAHKTRLVMFESPTNPVTKIADIAALTRLAKSAGALTVMDNTFAGFHQHGRVRSRFVRAQSHQVRLGRRGCDGRCRDRAHAS